MKKSERSNASFHKQRKYDLENSQPPILMLPFEVVTPNDLMKLWFNDL